MEYEPVRMFKSWKKGPGVLVTVLARIPWPQCTTLQISKLIFWLLTGTIGWVPVRFLSRYRTARCSRSSTSRTIQSLHFPTDFLPLSKTWPSLPFPGTRFVFGWLGLKQSFKDHGQGRIKFLVGRRHSLIFSEHFVFCRPRFTQFWPS